MSQPKRAVIFLMGPTAAGKTELALRLCGEMPCELISVDSAKVYRGMDIGTAKPDQAIRAQVPYRLIDICDPAESYSAARFQTDALAAIDDVFRTQNRIPLLVGGTGLYFRALEQGLSPLPGADPAVRKQLQQDAAAIGWPALHARLAKIDPQTAGRIHANDSQRIQRALEVYQLSGRPMSALLASGRNRRLAFTICKIIVAPGDRRVIHERVRARFLSMLEAGLVEEVEALFNRGDLCGSMPALRLVGYRQVWSYLEGKIDFDAMRTRAIAATRQLAKRQLTWFRSEQRADWYESTDLTISDKILASIRKRPELSPICNILNSI